MSKRQHFWIKAILQGLFASVFLTFVLPNEASWFVRVMAYFSLSFFVSIERWEWKKDE
jgi:hypothetical protein